MMIRVKYDQRGKHLLRETGLDGDLETAKMAIEREKRAKNHSQHTETTCRLRLFFLFF